MSDLTFKSIEWNDDLVGFVIELSNGKPLQVQFEKQQSRIHGGFGLWFPRIDRENDYGLDLTDEEEEQVIELINQSDIIKAKGLELDENE